MECIFILFLLYSKLSYNCNIMCIVQPPWMTKTDWLQRYTWLNGQNFKIRPTFIPTPVLTNPLARQHRDDSFCPDGPYNQQGSYMNFKFFILFKVHVKSKYIYFTGKQSTLSKTTSSLLFFLILCLSLFLMWNRAFYL